MTQIVKIKLIIGLLICCSLMLQLDIHVHALDDPADRVECSWCGASDVGKQIASSPVPLEASSHAQDFSRYTGVYLNQRILLTGPIRSPPFCS